MAFSELLKAAKYGDETAMTCLLKMYRGLITKHSYINESFDEDLFQEQQLCFIRCEKNLPEDFFEMCNETLS